MSKTPQKKLLIFGSGFMSRFIASAALDDGIEPIVLYNRHPLEDLDGIKQICFSSCNLTSILMDIDPSYIISLQGTSFVPDNKQLIEALNSNLMISIMFIKEVASLAKKGEISPKKIIFVGSAAEYGRSYLEPISETFPLYPTSIYGLTKIFLFNTAMYYYENGLPIIYARQFNCTGPYQRADFVVPSICRQTALIEKGKKDHISIGDISQERDFIDVRDTAQAYLTLLRLGIAGEIYNVGSGHTISISEVLEKAISFARPEIKIITKIDNKLFFDKNASSNKICADVTKLSALGFKARFCIDNTIYDSMEFWRKRV